MQKNPVRCRFDNILLTLKQIMNPLFYSKHIYITLYGTALLVTTLTAFIFQRQTTVCMFHLLKPLTLMSSQFQNMLLILTG